MRIQFNSLKAETVIATLAFLVAVLSLAFTIKQNNASQQHDRMSVKPHLSFQASRDQRLLKYEVDVINSGLGPAQIKEMRVFNQDQRLESADYRQKFQNFLDEGKLRNFVSDTFVGWFDENDSIAAGQSRPLLSVTLSPVGIEKMIDMVIEFPGINSQDAADTANKIKYDAQLVLFRKLEAVFSDLRIELDYESFYSVDSKTAILN